MLGTKCCTCSANDTQLDAPASHLVTRKKVKMFILSQHALITKKKTFQDFFMVLSRFFIYRHFNHTPRVHSQRGMNSLYTPSLAFATAVVYVLLHCTAQGNKV